MSSSQTTANALVELIFAKLTMVYGRDFLGRWEGLDIGEVKADWHRELRGWLQHPHAIRHALENLPASGKAPDVLQFRALCTNAPQPALKALPTPSADVARVSAALARARSAVMASHGTSWIDRLRAREAAGERLGLLQREALRRAHGAWPQSTEGGV